MFINNNFAKVYISLKYSIMCNYLKNKSPLAFSN
jgi:hypothetical protein